MIVPAERDEKRNTPEARHCEVCGTELSEKKASVGARCQNCALIEGTSGRSLEQIQNDLRADAPPSLPADELSPTAVRLLRRHPKLAELLEATFAEDDADKTLTLAGFVVAVADGEITASTADAKKYLERLTGWVEKRLASHDEKETLDRIIGLRAPGMHPPAIDRTRNRFRDENRFSEIILLRSLGATIHDAAEMVYRREEPASEAGVGEDPIDALAQRYTRSHLGGIELIKAFEDVLREESESMTPEDRREYLEQFPWVAEKLRKIYLK